MTRRALFELRHAAAAYDGHAVLSDIDLTVHAGECVALMGRSGAGKSTLLGLLYDQRPRDVALVPQAAALVKPLSVFHNVYMGRLDRRSTVYNLATLIRPRPQDISEIGKVLDDVGLADKIFAKAGALSGGQQQRTSVARALYNGRAVLIGDEPVSALDRVQGGDILRLLKRRHETLIVAMHDVALALEHADRVVVLDRGRKVLDRPSTDVVGSELVGLIGGVS